MFVLKINIQADGDTNNAVDHYKAISPDLADRFLSELYAVYQKIQEHPQFYKYISKRQHDNFRCVKLKSFPYIIVYKAEGDTIIVNAVFNTHRKPRYKG